MPADLAFKELLQYTDWERAKWLEWFRQQGPPALQVDAGPHGDGRFGKIGDLVRHIFSAEKRYVDRLSDRTITDTSTLPIDNLDALFQFGGESRRDLRAFLDSYPADQWEVMQELKMFNSTLVATPRKIISHVLMHEIRHWAQIATIYRFNGIKAEMHDLIFSPAMGGEFRRGA